VAAGRRGAGGLAARGCGLDGEGREAGVGLVEDGRLAGNLGKMENLGRLAVYVCSGIWALGKWKIPEKGGNGDAIFGGL
jgi:hypothetical protein